MNNMFVVFIFAIIFFISFVFASISKQACLALVKAPPLPSH